MQITESIVKTRWSIDFAQSEITFKVRHLMITHVKGAFKIFDATIYTTEKDFTTAEIDVWVNVPSLTTGDAKRDERIKGVDFFDAVTYKQIIFKAGKIKKAVGENMYDLQGHLTIKGIRKNIKLQVQFSGVFNDPAGKERAGFVIAGKINRRQWDLVWNSPVKNRSLMVSDEIVISCEIELTNGGSNELATDRENMPRQAAIL